ncbi:MAG: FAD:protein FMN transferase [Armatimonadota bacterium]
MTTSEPTTLFLDAMATRFEVILYGAESSRLRAAGEQALEEIADAEKRLSMFRPGSETSRINAFAAHQAVKIDARLYNLLKLAVRVSQATEGAFDITVAPAMQIWRNAGRLNRLPSDAEIDSARELVGAEMILFDDSDHTIRFAKEGVQIDPGAIGKGFAIDIAVESLRESGITSALIHGGTSTIYAIGNQINGQPWRIGVRDPATPDQSLRTVELCDASLSVSAPHGRLFACEGREYGHVIDPRTGRSVRRTSLAAVWGPSATETDALSTALLVLGEEGLEPIRRAFPDYDGLVVGL